jgi:hypothetical protein
MRRAWFLLLLVSGMHAELLDRVALYSGRQVITELQLDEEIRVTAFLTREPVRENPETRRAAAHRLVDQMLIEREMRLNRYPLPTDAEVEKYFQQVKGQFGSESSFERTLAAYRLSDAVLRAHLALQLTMLRFIDFRFRPEVFVSNEEIEKFYEANLQNWLRQRSDAPPPSLSASREAIRDAMIQQRADEALNAWLEQSRKQAKIVYLDRTLE